MSEKQSKSSESWVHHDRVQLESDNASLVQPLYHSVKYHLDSVETLLDVFEGKKENRYLYSRFANPTVKALEKKLLTMAGLERDGLAVSYGNGLQAISGLFLGLLSPGDHMISFLESYSPSRKLINQLLRPIGVSCSQYSLLEIDRIEIKANTKLIYFESPSNPQLRLMDLEKLQKLIAGKKIKTAIDATFAGPENYQDFDLNYRLYSLTKTIGGHGQAMGGAILGRQEDMRPLQEKAHLLGLALDPYSASMILEGSRTYEIRKKKMQENAEGIALWLERNLNEFSIGQLIYPGLDNYSQKSLLEDQLKDPGSIISFYLNQGRDFYHRFFDRLKMIKLAPSLGTVETLVAPIDYFYSDNIREEQKKKAGLEPFGVRLSCGVEDIGLIRQDLEQAFKQDQ